MKLNKTHIALSILTACLALAGCSSSSTEDPTKIIPGAPSGAQPAAGQAGTPGPTQAHPHP